MSFSEFDFHKDIKKGIKVAGFVEPSPIQKEAIPIILEGSDLIGQAHTGTGKTAAFGLPILDMIARGEIQKALIITPTRELATQVSDELYFLGRFAGIRTLAVYGGVGYGRQISLINKGVDIVVTTPGRLKDLYKKGKIDSFNPEVVVLDEADEMLDMGFLDDIREIFEYIPQNRQTMLFSATIPEPVKELANTILYNPEFISVIGKETIKNNDIKQFYYVIEEHQRDEAIIKLLEVEKFDKALIFCRTKKEVDRLNQHLNTLGFRALGLHGDIDQLERNTIVKSYRRGKTKILIATDVVARGIDIKNVTHVFNYHIPFDPQSYVHRIGRTGRAGKSGKAITLVSTEEFRELKRIQNEVGASMQLSTIRIGSQSLSKEMLSLIKTEILNTPIHPEIERAILEMADINQIEFIKRALSLIISYKKTLSKNRMLGYTQEELNKKLKEYEKDLKEKKKVKKKKKKKKD
jgi:ATP-dependent RNA helicase DeaD